MKEIKFNKKTSLLLLIVLWCIVSITFYWIPWIVEPLKLLNWLKDEVDVGYVSKQFLEKNIYSSIIIGIISIICISYSFIMCILFQKRKVKKYIGIGIVIQTFFMILLKSWNNTLVNADYNANDATEIISFKYWIVISFIICFIVCFLYFFNNKISYIILGASTALQILDTVELIKSNIEFLIQESITNPYYLPIVFQCINGVVIYVLYWTLIISFKNQNN